MAGEGLGFLGFEAADASGLDRIAARVEATGVAVTRGTRALADERHVADLIVFHDPGNHRIEVFHGAAIASDPFVPGRAISGFRTGPLGMGHVVLNVQSVERLLPFYRDVLGFSITTLRLLAEAADSHVLGHAAAKRRDGLGVCGGLAHWGAPGLEVGGS